MKKKRLAKNRMRTFYLVTLALLLIGVSVLFFLFWPGFSSQLEQGWSRLTRESKRILGWEKGEVVHEEQRIREEVILKKMMEANAHQDWRAFAPEYPRAKKIEPAHTEEKMKALKESPEWKEMDRTLKEYLKKKEDLYSPEPSLPSLKEALDLISIKDKGTERVMERLLSSKEKEAQEKPLEENLRLGIKGPLASRKILERPSPPSVKVKVEAEIELTLWVLPSGAVDRVIPSVKGDAELERIAIQYLKQWRFTPLPKDHPQVEQWGTIPIKFRLQ